MNEKIHNIALQVGGSHWPTVGGNLLEQSILMAVRECVSIALDNDDIHTAEVIAKRYGLDQWA
jgi:hypothetical protein